MPNGEDSWVFAATVSWLMVVATVLTVLGVAGFKWVFTTRLVDHCYVETKNDWNYVPDSDKTCKRVNKPLWCLRGNKEWSSDLDYGCFTSLEGALQDAKVLNCQVK